MSYQHVIIRDIPENTDIFLISCIAFHGSGFLFVCLLVLMLTNL